MKFGVKVAFPGLESSILQKNPNVGTKTFPQNFWYDLKIECKRPFSEHVSEMRLFVAVYDLEIDNFIICEKVASCSE